MATNSKGLPTSGSKWGVSMVVQDEARLGFILGYAEMIGATEIGWKAIREKDPARVAAGGRPKGRKSGIKRAQRVPRSETLSRMPSAFTTAQLMAYFKKLGRPTASAHGFLSNAVQRKLVRRVAPGQYEKAA